MFLFCAAYSARKVTNLADGRPALGAMRARALEWPRVSLIGPGERIERANKSQSQSKSAGTEVVERAKKGANNKHDDKKIDDNL